MLSDDSVENRHGPPGVNSRSLSAAHTAADLEVIIYIAVQYYYFITQISNNLSLVLEPHTMLPNCYEYKSTIHLTHGVE